MFLTRIGLIFLILSEISCISVKIPNTEVRRSSEIKFKAPQSQFESLNNGNVDAAWKSQQTGSIISLLSECPSGGAEVSLEALKSETLNGLSELKFDLESRKEFLGREALTSHLRGKLEGVESAIDLLIFKRNGCNYIATLVSTPKHTDSDRTEFQKFLNSLSLP